MAKVTGPLFSVSASGAIGKAMVHFPWKGLQCVRQFLIPTNPQTGSQGDARQILGGLGRITHPVIAESDFHDDAKAVTPTGSTWVAEFARYVRKHWMEDTAAYETIIAEFDAHTNAAMFTQAADDMDVADLAISYADTTDTFSKGAMLYVLAKYAIAKRVSGGVFDRAPYDTALADWSDTEIDAFCLDFGQTVESNPA